MVTELVLLAVVVMMVQSVDSSGAMSINASHWFHEKLENYDKHLRPYADEKPTDVSLQVSMVDLGPIVEKDFTFQVDMFIRQWWHDPRLKFQAGEVNFNGDPSKLIWIPDIFIRNSRKTITHKSAMETIRLRVQHDGSVYLVLRMSAICSCKMDLHRYPMDNQTCHMKFESFAYNSSELNMTWNPTPLEIPDDYQQVEGYKILKIEPLHYQKVYITGESFSVAEVSIKVERTFLFYVFSVFLPSSFLVAITWGTFFVPASSYPARCGLIVTNFLATLFILQGSSKAIPKVPYATALEVYLLVNTTFIAIVVIEYMLVIQFSAKGIKKKIKAMKKYSTSNGAADVELLDINKPNGGAEEEVKAKPKKPLRFHPVDKIAALLIPTAYLIFIVFYFSFYMSD